MPTFIECDYIRDFYIKWIIEFEILYKYALFAKTVQGDRLDDLLITLIIEFLILYKYSLFALQFQKTVHGNFATFLHLRIYTYIIILLKFLDI